MTTKVPVKLLDQKVVTSITVVNGALTINYSDGTSVQGSTIPKPKYIEYLDQVAGFVGPFNTPGEGGTNDSGAFAAMQVFVNGVLQVEGRNYTVHVAAGATGNITLVQSPIDRFDLVIFEF